MFVSYVKCVCFSVKCVCFNVKCVCFSVNCVCVSDAKISHRPALSVMMYIKQLKEKCYMCLQEILVSVCCLSNNIGYFSFTGNSII